MYFKEIDRKIVFSTWAESYTSDAFQFFLWWPLFPSGIICLHQRTTRNISCYRSALFTLYITLIVYMLTLIFFEVFTWIIFKIDFKERRRWAGGERDWDWDWLPPVLTPTGDQHPQPFSVRDGTTTHWTSWQGLFLCVCVCVCKH